MRLNDLKTGLDETIDITDEGDILSEAHVLDEYDHEAGTESIVTGKGSVSAKNDDNFFVSKNTTPNFDSIVSNKKVENKISKKLDISGKPGLLDIIKGKDYFVDNASAYGKYRFLVKFVGVLFALAIFLWIDKLLVTSYVESGYKRLLKIREDSGDIVMMQKNLNDARFDFIMADVLYYPFRLLPFKDVWNGHHIIKGGKNLTELGDNTFSLYTDISNLAVEKGVDNISYVNLLKNLRPELLASSEKLNTAIYHYDKVNGLSDGYIAYKLDQANDILKEISGLNDSINTHYDGLLKLLGSEGERKYLVVFQNADEIRPTGGFMGSMGIVTIQNGRFKDFDKRDVYNYEWNLKTEDFERLPAPKGIDRLTQYLGLRDANYLVNLKDSSENIKFFINKAGFEIDGVVYLNQNMIIDLLKTTGGVKLDYLDREITGNNFSALMSTVVEAKLTKIGTLGTPKQVLFDFIDAYMQKIKDEDLYPDVANVFIDNLLRREVGVHSFREDENKLLSGLNLGFNIDYSSTLDFAYPVYTSIGGNKSDRYMKREYNKTIEIKEDCSIQTNLEMTFKHLMTKNREDEIRDLMNVYDIADKNTILAIQGNSPNKSFIRVLLPKNANIQDNNLIEIIGHPSSKEVNFFVTTQRLETRGFNLYYSIPNPQCKPYDYKLYHQPGIREHSITISDGQNTTQKSGVNKDFYYSIN